MFSKNPSPVFALIIGIDSYKSGSIWNLHSCVDDAERVRRWLLHDLDVPKDQVCLLSDSHATKDNVEKAFMDHLVNNASIQQDDAVLIYFAGHGSRINAPKDWYHGVRKPRTVEVLCTYDFDSKADSHGRVAGISDRSLNAMLSELAAVKGDNITVILDCCFSPSQTPENIRERSRTRWTPPIRAVSEDLYRGLWPGARASPQHSQFGFLEPCPNTHIVIAACSPGHIAVEGKDGGRFTSGFLDAVSNLTLHHTTYTQLIEHMDRQATVDGQHAVCLGKQKSRVIFNDLPFVIDPQFISISSGRGRDQLRVEAGALHGVSEGSEFALHVHNYRCSRNPSFAVAVVITAHATWSLARLKTQDAKLPRWCWGRIIRWNNPNPFRVKLKTSVASLTKGWRFKHVMPVDTTRTLKSTGIAVQRVQTMAEADISLTMLRGRILVERHDTIIGNLGERTVRIQENNPIKVLNDAARFNMHLRSNNPEKPLENLTRVELYHINADTLTKVGGNLLRNGRAEIHCDYNIFTVTLKNTSKYDLWPYLVSMDPSNYATTMIFPHSEDDQRSPPLPAGGLLEIAANWPEPDDMSRWFSNRGISKSGFLKVYLVSTPTSLSMLGIPPSTAYVPPSRLSSMLMDGASIASSSRQTTIIHVWDTFLFHISFLR